MSLVLPIYVGTQHEFIFRKYILYLQSKLTFYLYK